MKPIIDFSDDELTTAISELGWGIQFWEIQPKSKIGSASALLNLLEPGVSILVIVSQEGWKTMSKSKNGDDVTVDDRSFETLDQLLTFESPAFENRRVKLLFEKLETISTRRDWGEADEYEEASL